MLFNSFEFLSFFVIVTIFYYLLPKKSRVYLLLIASYYFYMCWNVKYTFLILAITVLSFFVAIGIDKFYRYKKIILCSGCAISVGILFIYKYYNFFVCNVNCIFQQFHCNKRFDVINIILPVGISFYIFQAIGYMIDVYRKDISVEYNFPQYALFVSFFPQLVAGPIERSTNLLKQLKALDQIKYREENIKRGILLILWGLFEKTIISDRIATVVDEIYGNYTEYGLIPIVIATILFAIQIYCDFDGYTIIARGTAKVLGIELMNNFKQPYFSTSIHEFWGRWHISLSTWFRDYLYIPLGGNRKGTFRKYINLLIVFLVSGLWHGAEWTFVIWGGIHAVLNILEDMLQLNKRKNDTISKKIRNGIITFGFVDFAWLFFRADSITHVKGLLFQMVHQVGDLTDVLTCMGENDWRVLLVFVIILFVVDYLRYKGKAIFSLLEKQEIWFRWCIYLGLVCSLIYFQIYSVTYEPCQFIYFQF